MWAEEEGIDIRFLIHDRDTKFTEAFNEHFRRDEGRAVLTPYKAPIANCYAESWIGHLKRECLNLLFCFSLQQLDYVVQTYAEYYNEYRPNQSLDNRPLGTAESPPPQSAEVDVGSVRCRQFLGGLLKHYYRKTA
jgi:putative transposase